MDFLFKCDVKPCTTAAQIKYHLSKDHIKVGEYHKISFYLSIYLFIYLPIFLVPSSYIYIYKSSWNIYLYLFIPLHVLFVPILSAFSHFSIHLFSKKKDLKNQ